MTGNSSIYFIQLNLCQSLAARNMKITDFLSARTYWFFNSRWRLYYTWGSLSYLQILSLSHKVSFKRDSLGHWESRLHWKSSPSRWVPWHCATLDISSTCTIKCQLVTHTRLEAHSSSFLCISSSFVKSPRKSLLEITCNWSYAICCVVQLSLPFLCHHSSNEASILWS